MRSPRSVTKAFLKPCFRWQELLAEFDFVLEYKAGRTNQVADALSRKAELAALKLMAHLTSSQVASIKSVYEGKSVEQIQFDSPMNVPEPQARQIDFDKRTSWLRDQSHLEFDYGTESYPSHI